MSMIHCSACGHETLDTEQVCQFCGRRLKRPFWKRKLRWNEAYGVVLVVAGLAFLKYAKLIGVILIVGGVVLGASWLVRARIR